jgi:hypothetical protein
MKRLRSPATSERLDIALRALEKDITEFEATLDEGTS